MPRKLPSKKKKVNKTHRSRKAYGKTPKVNIYGGQRTFKTSTGKRTSRKNMQGQVKRKKTGKLRKRSRK